MKAEFWSKGDMPERAIAELNILQKIIQISCSAETSADPENWTEDNPLYGHCAIIAILVQSGCEGYLLRASLESVKGYEQMRSHYWNLLPNGIEIDMSSGQFKGNDRKLVPAGQAMKDGKVITAESLLANESTAKRYALLEKRFLENLKGPLKGPKKGCSDCKDCKKKKCKGD